MGFSSIDAIVTRQALTPAQASVPVFPSIQQALDAAPAQTATPWTILITAGHYREKIVVTRPSVTLIGEGSDRTILTNDCYAGQLRKDLNANWETRGCATLIVLAPGFVATSLQIRNDFDYLSNDAKDPADPSRIAAPQAVALMLDQDSDNARFENIEIAGFQDTLFVDAGESVFSTCRISGTVDFIFGSGQALFDRCDIVSRPRGQPKMHPAGYITAPSTSTAKSSGFVFRQCRLLRETLQVPEQSCALGRPWHPTTTFPDGRYADPDAVGSTIFIDCWMDSHILPEGWCGMHGTARGSAGKTWFSPKDARFFEYCSTGPGAGDNPSRRQLSDEMAATLGVLLPRKA